MIRAFLLLVVVVCAGVLVAPTLAAPGMAPSRPGSREEDRVRRRKAAFKAAEAACWKRAGELFGRSAAQSTEPQDKAGQTQEPIREPRKIHNVRPVYPDTVPRSSCIFMYHQALVGPSGEVLEVWPIRPDEDTAPCPEFEEPAAEAIRQWRYERIVVDGKPMPVCMTIVSHIQVR